MSPGTESIPGQVMGTATDSDAVRRFDLDLERTVDRLRGMALTRLSAPFAPEQTRARAARDLAQRLADHAAQVRGEPPRVVPELAVGAVADQVAVCGLDLREAVLTTPEASYVLSTAADDLLSVRRRL